MKEKLKRTSSIILMLILASNIISCKNQSKPETAIPVMETAVSGDSVPDMDKMRQSMLNNSLSVSTASTTEIVTEISSTENVPLKYIIKDVPLLEQLPDFPTGCESVSTCMVLNYYGYDISPREFIDEYLPKNDNFIHKNGLCYGPDPNEYFAGNPESDRSYGCMAPVIATALNYFFKGTEWGCITECGTIAELCEEYICKDIPVIVWTSMDMDMPRPGDIWTLSDGSTYQWLSGEHCMVLVGYDKKYYYFNDPYTGDTLKFGKKVSEKRYAAFECQSIAIIP